MKLFHKKGENDGVDQVARNKKRSFKLMGSRNPDYEEDLRKQIKKLLYGDDEDDEPIHEEDAYDQVKND